MRNLYFDTDNNRHNSFELPGSRPHYNPDRPGQVEHIFLDLALDIPHQSYRGICSIRLNPIRNGVDSLTLDAVNLQIDAVQIDSVEQEYDYDGEQLHIRLPQETEVGQPIAVRSLITLNNPNEDSILLRLLKTTLTNLFKSGRRAKMKIPAIGSPVLTIPDNWRPLRFECGFPNHSLLFLMEN